MYKHSITLNQPFDSARETLFAALAHAELSVVSDIDLQTTFRNKLGKEMRPYHIYGACSAPLAARIIDAEPDAGALLPCTVILRETSDAESVISFMCPRTVFGLAQNATIDEVATLAQQKIDQALAHLAQQHA